MEQVLGGPATQQGSCAIRVLPAIRIAIGQDVRQGEVRVRATASIADGASSRDRIFGGFSGLDHRAGLGVDRGPGKRSPGRVPRASQVLEQENGAPRRAESFSQIPDVGRCGSDAGEIRSFLQHGTGANRVGFGAAVGGQRAFGVAEGVSNEARRCLETRSLLLGLGNRQAPRDDDESLGAPLTRELHEGQGFQARGGRGLCFDDCPRLVESSAIELDAPERCGQEGSSGPVHRFRTERGEDLSGTLGIADAPAGFGCFDARAVRVDQREHTQSATELSGQAQSASELDANLDREFAGAKKLLGAIDHRTRYRLSPECERDLERLAGHRERARAGFDGRKLEALRLGRFGQALQSFRERLVIEGDERPARRGRSDQMNEKSSASKLVEGAEGHRARVDRVAPESLHLAGDFDGIFQPPPRGSSEEDPALAPLRGGEDLLGAGPPDTLARRRAADAAWTRSVFPVRRGRTGPSAEPR